MGAHERGFTLLEIAVALGIFAMLLLAGLWAMATHPTALVSATDDLDAALASARAIAASSGNGATLVFSARNDGGKGFVLRLYRGRPDESGAVQPESTMDLVSSAGIKERTLGSPPFSIFIDSAGDASGIASYPSFDSSGAAEFTVIPQEPPCPNGGFLITLTNPQGTASATRALPCRSVLPQGTLPAVSPTPNVPIVTPTALLFHWPTDGQQQFVATEWGYTHWFASGTGFSCGNQIAQFPNVLPSPFSAPANPQELELAPAPPPQTPYSYPNSNGASMNDAPALFLLQPLGDGECLASVEDEYGQSASAPVVVMGWLTAGYGGQSATHATGSIALPSSALGAAGSSATISVAKSFDAAPLSPQLAFVGGNAAACALDLSPTPAGGVTPATPSNAPATASLTLTVNALPPAALSCSAILFNHYSGANAPSDAASESGEGVPVTIALAAPPTPTPAPTSTPERCVAGSTCGVAIYEIINVCASLGGGIYAYAASALTSYYQSNDGGASWTSTWRNDKSYGSGHATGCPTPQGESVYGAGNPPQDDPVNWAGVRAGTDGSGVITWTPPDPPSYVSSQSWD
jgi:prepilin-type N-terminal cleavage/methylation domain-containing protein